MKRITRPTQAPPNGKLAAQIIVGPPTYIALDEEQMALVAQLAARAPEFQLAIGGFLKGQGVTGSYALRVAAAELIRQEAPEG